MSAMSLQHTFKNLVTNKVFVVVYLFTVECEWPQITLDNIGFYVDFIRLSSLIIFEQMIVIITSPVSGRHWRSRSGHSATKYPLLVCIEIDDGEVWLTLSTSFME